MPLNTADFAAYLESRQYSPDYINARIRRLKIAIKTGITEEDMRQCTPMQLSRKMYGDNITKSVRKAVTTLQNRYCDYLQEAAA